MSKTITQTPDEALQAAIKKAGTQADLAALLKISQTAISKWSLAGKGCSGRFALKIEEATGISRHELAPEFYPID